MPRPPSCGEYAGGGCVMGGFAAGVGYLTVWLGFGFEEWGAWHHAGLIGGSLAAGGLVAVGVLNAAHRKAVAKFGEGKFIRPPCGQKPPPYPPVPPPDPEA